MDESSSIPREGLLISSVLGVKNSLRFRAHQSTLKAHAILRRVENSDNSDDEEEPSSYVLYKLVAQKRFTITPGKEILLTVEDDRFKDRAVLFSGIPLAPEDSPEEITEIPPLPKKSLPPKMRRAWTKKTDDTGKWRIFCSLNQSLRAFFINRESNQSACICWCASNNTYKLDSFSSTAILTDGLRSIRTISNICVCANA